MNKPEIKMIQGGHDALLDNPDAIKKYLTKLFKTESYANSSLDD